MADLCGHCGAPAAQSWPGTSAVDSAICYAVVSLGTGEHDWAALACRDRELEATQRALASAKALIAHARVLLLRTRDALDLALAETEPDEPGADGG